MAETRIPSIKEYMDKNMSSITYGTTVHGEYEDILYWIKQYCAIVIDKCAEQSCDTDMIYNIKDQL